MTYTELKAKHQKEVNEFPFGFAFSEKQFNEMMINFGLKPEDTDKIYSIGAGGYIKKTDSDKMDEMFNRHRTEINNAINDKHNGTKFAFEMFSYELANHEYGYTGDLEETLDALGYTREQVRENKNLYNGLIKAMSKYEKRRKI